LSGGLSQRGLSQNLFRHIKHAPAGATALVAEQTVGFFFGNPAALEDSFGALHDLSLFERDMESVPLRHRRGHACKRQCRANGSGLKGFVGDAPESQEAQHTVVGAQGEDQHVARAVLQAFGQVGEAFIADSRGVKRFGGAAQLGDKQVDGPSLAKVCRRYGVRELSLFGSTARGEMRPESDVDVMVEFEPDARVGIVKFESLAEELEALVRRKVDLVTWRVLKPWVCSQVLEDARVVYAA